MRYKLLLALLVCGPSALAIAAGPRIAPDIHAEWVKYANRAGDSVTAYLAYPERADPAPAMIVIHEIFGLSDWIREVTEDLAEAGYVAIAPDLLSRRGGTSAQEDARRAISSLPPDSITMDLDGTFEYLQSLKAVRGDAIGVIGFCWGGGQSFRYATSNPRLKAAVVCYGPAPDLATVERIAAPVLGIYAENDARINASLPEVERAMKEAGKTFRPTVYPGTGHGFLRTKDQPSQAERAWRDIVSFLREYLDR